MHNDIMWVNVLHGPFFRGGPGAEEVYQFGQASLSDTCEQGFVLIWTQVANLQLLPVAPFNACYML